MKNYDYKDETKDVKGKVSYHQKSKIYRFEAEFILFVNQSVHMLILFLTSIDWET